MCICGGILSLAFAFCDQSYQLLRAGFLSCGFDIAFVTGDWLDVVGQCGAGTRCRADESAGQGGTASCKLATS